MTENHELPQVDAAKESRPSVWAQIAASLAFSYATYEMLRLYGLVHWKIMLDREAYPDTASVSYVLEVLGHLAWLRFVFAALALVFAFWSFRGRPRWGAFVALAFAGVALFSVFLMT